MKIWKSLKKSCLKAIALICVLFSIGVLAQPVKLLNLKHGLWEGINSNLGQYNILELSEDGQHRFFNVNIATAFKKTKVMTFSDENISCTNLECTININDRSGEITRLIISPYLESSFKVLEINADAEGQPIFTQTYQLDQNNEQSTVRAFIKKYRHKIEYLTEIKSDGIYGFWLGILIMDGKPELLSFEVHPDTKSHFTRFINGQSYVNKASFLPEKVIIDQEVIYIETEHPTFANKLIVHQLSKGMLSGHMYSIHKGHTLQTGKFSLMRVR